MSWADTVSAHICETYPRRIAQDPKHTSLMIDSMLHSFLDELVSLANVVSHMARGSPVGASLRYHHRIVFYDITSHPSNHQSSLRSTRAVIPCVTNMTHKTYTRTCTCTQTRTDAHTHTHIRTRARARTKPARTQHRAVRNGRWPRCCRAASRGRSHDRAPSSHGWRRGSRFSR